MTLPPFMDMVGAASGPRLVVEPSGAFNNTGPQRSIACSSIVERDHHLTVTWSVPPRSVVKHIEVAGRVVWQPTTEEHFMHRGSWIWTVDRELPGGRQIPTVRGGLKWRH